jgi:hypothetical protein
MESVNSFEIGSDFISFNKTGLRLWMDRDTLLPLLPLSLSILFSLLHPVLSPLWYVSVMYNNVRGCIQKFSDWPPGARTANGTALCH